jgi:hypothetical protein
MSDELVSAVLIKNEIKRSTESLKELNKQNSILQNRLFWLTIVTSILACIQTVILIVQVFAGYA